MTAFIKKQGPAFYFNILSAAAGIVAFVAMVVSSTMNEAYALNSFPLFVLGAIAGILLIVIAVYAANRWGKLRLCRDTVRCGCRCSFSAVIGGIIMNRVLLIFRIIFLELRQYARLERILCQCGFPFACFVISIVLLIIGSFLKSVK